MSPPTYDIMTRQKLLGSALAVALLTAPAFGYALSCFFPAERAELTEPAESEFEGVNITVTAGYQEVMLELVHADGSEGWVGLTYRAEGVQ